MSFVDFISLLAMLIYMYEKIMFPERDVDPTQIRQSLTDAKEREKWRKILRGCTDVIRAPRPIKKGLKEGSKDKAEPNTKMKNGWRK